MQVHEKCWIYAFIHYLWFGTSTNDSECICSVATTQFIFILSKINILFIIFIEINTIRCCIWYVWPRWIHALRNGKCGNCEMWSFWPSFAKSRSSTETNGIYVNNIFFVVFCFKQIHDPTNMNKFMKIIEVGTRRSVKQVSCQSENRETKKNGKWKGCPLKLNTIFVVVSSQNIKCILWKHRPDLEAVGMSKYVGILFNSPLWEKFFIFEEHGSSIPQTSKILWK